MLGLLFAPIAIASLRFVNYSSAAYYRSAQVLAVLFCASLMFPVASIVVAPDAIAAGSGGAIGSVMNIAMIGLRLATIALGAAIVVFMMRAHPADQLTRIAGIILIAVAAVTGGSGYADVLAVVVAVLAFGWLMPRNRQAQADRLSRVVAKVHKRLMFAESWRRLSLRAGQEHFRTARHKLAESPADGTTLRAAQATIDQATGLTAQRSSSGIYLPEAALGSAAGYSARTNAATAIILGLLLAIPLASYELLGGPWSRLDLIPTALLLMDATAALRWAVYALIFGYFYPWLRGQVPVNKALAMLGCIIAVELVRFASTVEDASHGDIAVAAAIRVGQATAFCLGLGLFWEWRLVHASGMRWARIRDFRSLQALGTPLTTVMVAALTAVTTALAGAAVMTILTGSQPGVEPRDTPSQQPTIQQQSR